MAGTLGRLWNGFTNLFGITSADASPGAEAGQGQSAQAGGQHAQQLHLDLTPKTELAVPDSRLPIVILVDGPGGTNIDQGAQAAFETLRQHPNRIETAPVIRMQFEEYDPTLQGDKALEAFQESMRQARNGVDAQIQTGLTNANNLVIDVQNWDAKEVTKLADQLVNNKSFWQTSAYAVEYRGVMLAPREQTLQNVESYLFAVKGGYTYPGPEQAIPDVEAKSRADFVKRVQGVVGHVHSVALADERGVTFVRNREFMGEQPLQPRYVDMMISTSTVAQLANVCMGYHQLDLNVPIGAEIDPRVLETIKDGRELPLNQQTPAVLKHLAGMQGAGANLARELVEGQIGRVLKLCGVATTSPDMAAVVAQTDLSRVELRNAALAMSDGNQLGNLAIGLADLALGRKGELPAVVQQVVNTAALGAWSAIGGKKDHEDQVEVARNRLSKHYGGLPGLYGAANQILEGFAKDQGYRVVDSRQTNGLQQQFNEDPQGFFRGRRDQMLASTGYLVMFETRAGQAVILKTPGYEQSQEQAKGQGQAQAQGQAAAVPRGQPGQQAPAQAPAPSMGGVKPVGEAEDAAHTIMQRDWKRQEELQDKPTLVWDRSALTAGQGALLGGVQNLAGVVPEEGLTYRMAGVREEAPTILMTDESVWTEEQWAQHDAEQQRKAKKDPEPEKEPVAQQSDKKAKGVAR